MPIDNAEFRGAMRLLAGGVTIIATQWENERSGLTATAVCSLALSPARVLACVNIGGRTYELLTRSRCMSVNLLAQDQVDVARRFAGMLGPRDEDRFDVAEWQSRSTGAPLLSDCLVALDCRIVQMTTLDTHAILIGAVETAIFGSRRSPLLHYDGDFTTALSSFETSHAVA